MESALEVVASLGNDVRSVGRNDIVVVVSVRGRWMNVTCYIPCRMILDCKQS